ncbi:MAG: hypothetical protein ACRD0N_02790 [Acidimicrobiales bacterium]
MAGWPPDPEQWSDEQWLAWLNETDGVPPEGAEAAAAEAGGDLEPEESWRSKGMGTQLVAAAMIGLAEALHGPREKPAIVIDASGDKPNDDGLDLQLDPDHPEQSVVVVRPWLLRHLAERPPGP